MAARVRAAVAVLCAESDGGTLDRAFKVSMAAVAAHNSEPILVWQQVRLWRALATTGPEQLELPLGH